MTDKRILSVALERGFLDDRVRLRVGDREVADLDRVSTRVQIGLARKIDVEVDGSDRTLTVELPDKRTEASVALAGSSAYVGVSVADDGKTLTLRSGEAPVGYA